MHLLKTTYIHKILLTQFGITTKSKIMTGIWTINYQCESFSGGLKIKIPDRISFTKVAYNLPGFSYRAGNIEYGPELFEFLGCNVLRSRAELMAQSLYLV